MSWSIETARKHLNVWLEAELKVATGQSYRIGTKQLNRADLSEIRYQIKFWKNEIAKLENTKNKKGRNRVFRVVPRDL